MTEGLHEGDVSGHYPEPSEAAKTFQRLRAANEATMVRIDKLGAGINPASLDAARDSHLMSWIYTNIMTEAQREDFLISWHTAFAEQLQKVEEQARDIAVQRTRGKLATPPAGKLIVPGR